MLPTPLQITVCYSKKDDQSKELGDIIVKAFKGGGSGYLQGGDDLKLPVRVFTRRPKRSPDVQLERSVMHSLLIVLLSRDLIDDVDFLDWINNACGFIERTDPRNKLLIVDLDDSLKLANDRLAKAQWNQAVQYGALGEQAIRSTKVALISLSLATQAITSGSPMLGERMRFFVSHAKLDGQALAKGLADLIHELPGFEAFYDASDIPPGSNWQRVLMEGVQNSIIIVLRSQQYEKRPWCVQEAVWAEEYACPVIVVDLRTALMDEPSKLSLSYSPSVKIADGNYYRVIYASVREGLRARLHVRTVQWFCDEGHLEEAKTKVLVRQPSMLALQRCCVDLLSGPNRARKTGSSAKRRMIVYPDPPMHEGAFAAAKSLVSSYSPDIDLVTVQSIMPTALIGRAA